MTLSNSTFSEESSSSEEEESSEEFQSNSGEDEKAQTSGSESHKSHRSSHPFKRGIVHKIRWWLKDRVVNQEAKLVCGLNNYI